MSGKLNKDPYQTSLSKAKGSGSSHSGVHHWIPQRVTAVALIPLSIWLVYHLVRLSAQSYTDALDWVQSPSGAIGIISFMFASFYHAYLGMQMIFEDYSSLKTRIIARFGLLFIFVLLGVLVVLSIFRQAT